MEALLLHRVGHPMRSSVVGDESIPVFKISCLGFRFVEDDEFRFAEDDEAGLAPGFGLSAT